MFWYNFCVYFSSRFVIIPNRSFAFINYSFPFVTSLHVMIAHHKRVTFCLFGNEICSICFN